ncbi:MAG TPA: PD-(D/E)XK nuclease family protein [Phycisphaerae bacterium]|nr:PD-(D/E)XK nuclease family protein [Phycisphaerae bacterium]
MAVRFIIGRAGAGKTDHCLRAARGALVASPVEGPALILLVPEQAALQTERTLIDAPGLGGAHRAAVVGFRRLAARVLAACGVRERTTLSANGRAMTLRYLLARLSGRLQYYRRVERLSGFIERLSQSVGELFDEAVAPEDLREAAAAAADDPVRSRKLADLHLIYAAYLEHLGSDRMDPSQYLELARRHVAGCGWLREAQVWVDGFAGYTRQETLMLTALAQTVGRLEITVLLDPEAIDHDHPPGHDSADLFVKPLRTYLDLRSTFAAAGVEIEHPVLLPADRSVRFASNAQLADLERRLFTGGAPLRQPNTGSETLPVELVELPDRRIEVDYAVSRVCRWVQRKQDPLRYRDIALIVRDLDPYHDLLSAALAERNIPFFIDRRRPTAHHPLVELLRALVMLAADSLSIESVRLALKTGLLAIDDEDADEFENFVLAHGIAGFELYAAGDWSPIAREDRIGPLDVQPDAKQQTEAQRRELARVNATRRTFLDRIGGWLSFARATDAPDGRTWAGKLADALQALSVPDQLARWATEAEDEGDLDAAEEHRQIWRDTTAFIDDLADALSDQPMTVRELAAVLDAGLSQFTLGLAPPMLDQVLVGAVERSRHPDIKAVIVLGFNDGAFPRTGSEDTILNDEDRAFLEANGLPVGTPRRRRILEERLLAYVALTRASECVLVTYPTANEAGKPLSASSYAEDLRAACPRLRVCAIDAPVHSREMWPLMSSDDLAAGLALEFRSRPASPEADTPLRGRWNGLYERARTDEQLRGRLSRALGALAYVNQATLSGESVSRMVRHTLEASVTRLETFAACPFQHLARYGLKLKKRRLAVIESVDVGKLHHAILEDFVARLVDEGRPMGQLDDREVLDRLAHSCGRIGVRPSLSGEPSSPRDVYLMRRGRSDLAKVLQAQRNVSALGRFRPRQSEIPFGFDKEGSLPALEIDTPAGRRVRLRGYIDRVDLAELADQMLGVVVDYKRTGREQRLDLSRVFHGLSLQLLGYLLVLAEHGRTMGGRPVQPIGAFYVSLRTGYAKLDHPDDYDEAKDSPLRRHRPRGVLDVERIQDLDAGFDGSSDTFVVRTKDGKIQYADRSDGADAGQFAALLDHTRRTLGALADRILDGDVAVAPYRLGDFSPCAWCDYRSVCRFEFGQSGMRLLERLNRQEVLARLTGGADAETEA